MTDCPSGAAPCDHWRHTRRLCQICQVSEDEHHKKELEKALTNARRFLEANGYKVLTPNEVEDARVNAILKEVRKP